MIDMRRVITRRLKQMQKSRYWLAQKSKVRAATVYDFLGGKMDVTAQTACKLLDVLGMEIRPSSTDDKPEKTKRK